MTWFLNIHWNKLNKAGLVSFILKTMTHESVPPGCLCWGSCPVLLQYLQGGRSSLLLSFTAVGHFSLVSSPERDEDEEEDTSGSLFPTSISSSALLSPSVPSQLDGLRFVAAQEELRAQADEVTCSSCTILSWWEGEMGRTRLPGTRDTQPFHISTRRLGAPSAAARDGLQVSAN